MQKFLSGLAASAAFALFASSGLACEFHNRQSMASAAPAESVVAMSTYEGTPPAVADRQMAAPECPADAKDCVPANK